MKVGDKVKFKYSSQARKGVLEKDELNSTHWVVRDDDGNLYANMSESNMSVYFEPGDVVETLPSYLFYDSENKIGVIVSQPIKDVYWVKLKRSNPNAKSGLWGVMAQNLSLVASNEDIKHCIFIPPSYREWNRVTQIIEGVASTRFEEKQIKKEISLYDVLDEFKRGHLTHEQATNWFNYIVGCAKNSPAWDNPNRIMDIPSHAGTIVNKFGDTGIKFLKDNGYVDITPKPIYEFGQKVQFFIGDDPDNDAQWHDALYLGSCSDKERPHRICPWNSYATDWFSDSCLRPAK